MASTILLQRQRPQSLNRKLKVNQCRASLGNLELYRVLYQLPLDKQAKHHLFLQPKHNHRRHRPPPQDDLFNLLPQTYQDPLPPHPLLLVRQWLPNLHRPKPQRQLDSSRYLLQERHRVH